MGTHIPGNNSIPQWSKHNWQDFELPERYNINDNDTLLERGRLQRRVIIERQR